MPDVAAMLSYLRPTAIKSEQLGMRIFSPFAYQLVRELAVVPIGFDEAVELSVWLPVVWQKSATGHRLVQVRSLIPSESGVPPDCVGNIHSLPLVAIAYPLMFAPDQPPAPHGALWIDHSIADLPTDSGATLVDVGGKLTKGTTMRMKALGELAEQLSATQRITQYLAERDLFEPWDVTFDVSGRRIGYQDLFVLKKEAFEASELLRPILAHGVMAARFLSAHRLSLFRTGNLLRTARIALSKAPPPAAAASAMSVAVESPRVS